MPAGVSAAAHGKHLCHRVFLRNTHLRLGLAGRGNMKSSPSATDSTAAGGRDGRANPRSRPKFYAEIWAAMQTTLDCQCARCVSDLFQPRFGGSGFREKQDFSTVTSREQPDAPGRNLFYIVRKSSDLRARAGEVCFAYCACTEKLQFSALVGKCTVCAAFVLKS